MKANMQFAIVVFAMLALGAKSVLNNIKATDIGDKFLVIGDSGYPLGQEITIRGHKTNAGLGDNNFDVEAIDGKKQSLIIEVDGIQSWPDKTGATLRGYEEGYIRYLNVKDTQLPNGAHFTPRQRIFVGFHANKVVEPTDLKLSAEKN